MPVNPIPAGYTTITPYLLAQEADKLIDYLKAAFNAEVKSKSEFEGRLMHAELKIGNSMLMAGGANQQWPAMPCMLYVYVPNVDEVYANAIKAGGKSLREPTNEFYGDRSCGVLDPFGNQWWIATHVEDVAPEEIARRQKELNNK